MLSFRTLPAEAEADATSVDVEAIRMADLLSWTYLSRFANVANCSSSYGRRDLLAVSLAVLLPDSVSRLLHLSWSSTQMSKASARCFLASSHAAGVE